jgi:hypothetical protein
MSELTLAPRRRSLWRLFIMPVLVLVAAIAWSAFWFYAASKVDETAEAWRAREAKSGRVYECAKHSLAGFPFRFEARCSGASVALLSQTAGASQAPITAKLDEILVVAQVYDPKLLIAEFTAPATVSGPDRLSRAAASSVCPRCRNAWQSCSTIRPSTASMPRCRRRWRAPGTSNCTRAWRTARRRIVR